MRLKPFISLRQHLKQHLLQLREANSIISLRLQHIFQNTLQASISHFANFLMQQIEVDGKSIEIIEMSHTPEMHHMQQGHSERKNAAFIGQSIHKSRLLEEPQCFRGIIKLFLLIEVKLMITETRRKHLADPFFIYYDILRVECVMQDLIFVKIRKSQHTTTQYRHNLLHRKGPSRVKPTLNFIEEGMALILKVLGKPKLLGADVGLRDDLAIKGIEVKLMRQGEVSLVSLHVFVELLLAGEGMLHDDSHFLGDLVTHDRTALGQLAHELVVADLGLGGGAVGEGNALGSAHRFRLLQLTIYSQSNISDLLPFCSQSGKQGQVQ